MSADYNGVGTLENLKEAKNYNGYIEKQLLKFIQGKNRVLDFGAGNGEFAVRLKSKGINVDCIETDKYLQQSLERDGFRVCGSLSGVSGKYDRIYSLNVLEHIEDDIGALHELKSKLDTQGKLFIYVPALMFLYSDFDKKIGHFRRYTKKELTSKMKQAGLNIESARYVDSVGVLAWLVMKIFKRGDGDISKKAIIVYDRFCFPISLLVDLFCKPFFGKNLLVVANI